MAANTGYLAVRIDVHAQRVDGKRMSFKAIQDFVGGYVEPVYRALPGCVLLVHEEGLLVQPPLPAFALRGGVYVGNAVAVAAPPGAEDFADCPMQPADVALLVRWMAQ